MNRRLAVFVVISIVSIAFLTGFTFYLYLSFKPQVNPLFWLIGFEDNANILFEDFEIMDTSRWYWRTDGNGQISCSNSVAEFKIPSSTGDLYSNAEIYDAEGRLPYRQITAVFNVRCVNPTNGSRGWGFWNGLFGSDMNLVWFMYMNRSATHDGLWTYVVRNGDTWSNQVTDVKLSLWHNYTIIWRSESVDFLVDGEAKSRFEGDTPDANMRLDIWVDNRTWEEPVTLHPISEETKLLVDWVIIYY